MLHGGHLLKERSAFENVYSISLLRTPVYSSLNCTYSLMDLMAAVLWINVFDIGLMGK